MNMAKKAVTEFRIKRHQPGMIYVPGVGNVNTQAIKPSQLARLKALGVPLEEVTKTDVINVQ